jgi:hypothetical protein
MRARWVAVGSAVALAALAGCAQRADRSEVSGLVAEATEEAEAADREEGSVDAVMEQMLALGTDDIMSAVSPAEVQCVEEEVVDADLDLRAAVSDPDAVEERVHLGEILLGCLEDTAPLGRMFVANLKAISPSLDISDADGACLVDEIIANAEDPARLLVAGDGPPSDLQVLFDAAEACFPPEAYAAFIGEEGSGPQAYGDDDRLDSMQDDCEAGELRACDLLFLASSEGSEYEEVAATCGGTTEDTGAFCTEEPELSATGFAPTSSPGLDVLAADCEDGDLTACDLLYLLVAPGHELENVGFTCGGRIAVGAVPDCRTRLG